MWVGRVILAAKLADRYSRWMNSGLRESTVSKNLLRSAIVFSDEEREERNFPW